MRRLALCTCLAAAVVASPQAQSPKKHFLWTVSAPGAPSSYLLGSLHALKADYYPLSPIIEEAFTRSTVLIEEIDFDEMLNPSTAWEMVGKGMLTDGRTLDQLLPADLYKAIVERGEKVGLPAVALQRMKPWMVAVTLTTPALKAEGFDAELGVDRHYFDKAKKAGKQRRALETVAYQLERFDQLPQATQEAMLRSVLSDVDSRVPKMKEIADAWARGDIATIAEMDIEAFRESPELHERLLVERNRNWVAPVEACLKDKTSCFVVVGAAHLVGPDSLVALLEKKGYRVEQQ